MFNREILLIGEENYNKIKNTFVAIIGIGGVGGYALETLIRSGIENIIIVDYDKVDITNINRQIIATTKTIGNKKTLVAKNRILEINPNCNVKILDMFYDKDKVDELFNNKIDYIIDCCDSVEAKISLITESTKRNIKIISSMGTGNKLDPKKFKIDKLKNTSYCPLAKKIRTILKNNKEALNTNVLYSTEEPKKGLNTISSISFTPSVAGILLARHVILDIIKEN